MTLGLGFLPSFLGSAKVDPKSRSVFLCDFLGSKERFPESDALGA